MIACDLVIQLIDQLTGSYLVALDRTTGRVRWKRDRPGATIGYATPMVFRPSADRADIITIGSTRLDAYDLANGRLSVRTGEAVYCFTGPRLPEPSR